MDVFKTTAGSVRGYRPVPEVVAVLGVPYAAAPFGVNRFREPQPPQAWGGVRGCADFGPVAPQSAQLPGAPVWSAGQEEILTVNVWTPVPDGGTLPVLVWIHGGAYTFGSSAQPDFDATTLARAGLVVVTFNYRLGFEGFGHVPAAGERSCPDNRGLLDQVAALRWVRANIAGFGGDPGNVTVAGQSSGAASAACLMVMERARGLFQRVIAHSVVDSFSSLESAGRTTREVAAAASCSATADGLSGTAPQDLVAASDRVVERYRRDPFSGRRHYNPVIYAPVLDGDVLSADPLTAVAAGRGRDIDLLVCHTTEEFWLFDAVGSTAKVTSEQQLARFAEDFDLPEELVDGYRGRMPGAAAHDVYLAILSDLFFSGYSSRLAEAHTRSGGRTFLSRFDRRRSSPHGTVRAWHCADVPFAFGNVDAECVEFLIGGPPTRQDHELSQRMVRAWADFAAAGEPGWQALDEDAEHVRVWATDEAELHSNQ